MTRNGATLKDIYEVVQRVEDKLDARVKGVESRIDVLEDFRSKALGVMSIATIVLTAVWSWLWSRVTGKA